MSGPSAGGTSNDVETSGPSLRLVLGIMGALIVVLGITAYWRYTVSEGWFARSLPVLSETGKTVDTEGCVDAVLRWHETCDANKPLCDNGVPRAMTHCLMGGDRVRACASLSGESAKAQWVFKSCFDRGTPCTKRKKCACADAYRALDSFCRHDQTGVAL